jgi:hypothetical protein
MNNLEKANNTHMQKFADMSRKSEALEKVRGRGVLRDRGKKGWADGRFLGVEVYTGITYSDIDSGFAYACKGGIDGVEDDE